MLVSIGFEEMRRTSNWEMVEKALDTILESYEDWRVIKVVESLAKRAREEASQKG